MQPTPQFSFSSAFHINAFINRKTNQIQGLLHDWLIDWLIVRECVRVYGGCARKERKAMWVFLYSQPIHQSVAARWVLRSTKLLLAAGPRIGCLAWEFGEVCPVLVYHVESILVYIYCIYLFTYSTVRERGISWTKVEKFRLTRVYNIAFLRPTSHPPN